MPAMTRAPQPREEKWIRCDGYELIVHNARQSNPRTKFDLTAFGLNGKRYAYSYSESKSDKLAREILQVLQEVWPRRDIEVQAEDDGFIFGIRPSSRVRIAALLPNPVGQDRGKETVTLVNTSSRAVSISGWTLVNRAQKVEELRGRIEANREKIIKITEGNFSLNNAGDEIQLLDKNGRVVNSAKYTASEAKEGKTIRFDGGKDAGDEFDVLEAPV